MNKLLVLDTRTVEFSTVGLPPEQPGRFFIVEAVEGMLGVVTKGW